ncbi:hypothetical protein EJB05_31893, partial [Eragrostis curvula]
MEHQPIRTEERGQHPKATVTQLPDHGPAALPPCTVTYAVPAVLFAIGGHSGRSFFHDHSDVLVPLFAASRRVCPGTRSWPWTATHVRCFPHVTVGLHIHKLFNIVPELAPGPGGRRLTMSDFTAFLREAYALPRHEAVSLAPRESPPPAKKKKPLLLLIQRKRYRRFVNGDELARAAEAAGFETVVSDVGDNTTRVAEQARTVNSFDAMVGVHGAGLTNAMFLPPGAVHIQVVPYGKMEAIARSEYGDPMIDMGLEYLEYVIGLEESTLLETLGPDHPAVRDPESVHRSGWDMVNEFYLKKQDLRINITRFAPTLAQAFEHLRRRQ